jgi:hypothetical protein
MRLRTASPGLDAISRNSTARLIAVLRIEQTRRAELAFNWPAPIAL